MSRCLDPQTPPEKVFRGSKHLLTRYLEDFGRLGFALPKYLDSTEQKFKILEWHSIESWLVNGDPYKGLLWSLYNWVLHPLYTTSKTRVLNTAQLHPFRAGPIGRGDAQLVVEFISQGFANGHGEDLYLPTTFVSTNHPNATYPQK